jgi:hypothetical protein
MSDSDLALTRYYDRVDADDIDGAAEQFDPDARFAIILPGSTRRGTGRSGIADYLNGRGDVVRRHVILRTAADGDVEFVYGAVTENSTVTTGHFSATAHLTPAGLIDAYQVVFDTELTLIP